MEAPKIIDAADAASDRTARTSPVTKIIDSIGGDYLTSRQVAEHFKVHTETIRRLSKALDKDGNPKVNAPSKAAVVGGLKIYLFTPEDMEELKEYFGSRTMTYAKEKDED